MKSVDHIFYAEEMNPQNQSIYPSYLQCEECQVNMPDNVIIKLMDKYRTQCFCPNCVAIKEQNGTLQLENDPDLLCDASFDWGAVVYKSGQEQYVLRNDIMHRLLQHNLMPDEWHILKKREKIDDFQYQLHEDFYAEDGTALQPLIQSEEQERE